MDFNEMFKARLSELSIIIGESIRNEIDLIPEKHLSKEEYEFISKIATTCSYHFLRAYHEELSKVLPELRE